jgi:hypothetical protein
MDTVISLGDVAKSNDAADAWWCVRALDWSDIALRRQVIAALMPSVERAAKHTTDKRVADCIAAIHDWIAGRPADLEAAEAAAWAAEAAAWAAGAAARAAEAAARAVSLALSADIVRGVFPEPPGLIEEPRMRDREFPVDGLPGGEAFPETRKRLCD